MFPTLMVRVLRGEGIDVRLGHKAVRFEADGEKRLIAQAQEQTIDIPFDEVLVAVGRRAHTKSLGIEELGIELNRDGTVVVDEYMRTNDSECLRVR